MGDGAYFLTFGPVVTSEVGRRKADRFSGRIGPEIEHIVNPYLNSAYGSIKKRTHGKGALRDMRLKFCCHRVQR